MIVLVFRYFLSSEGYKSEVILSCGGLVCSLCQIVGQSHVTGTTPGASSLM